MEITVECKNIFRCFSVEAWLEVMIISRVLWACLVDLLNIKFGLLERLMCGVFLGWVIEWLEVRFVIPEVWIQNVDNVVLSREIISVFVVAKKFFLSRLPRLWYQSYWDDIHMFVGCCIVSRVVMCVNTSLSWRRIRGIYQMWLNYIWPKPSDCILV